MTVASLQRNRPGHDMSADIQVNRPQDGDIRKATERDIPPKMMENVLRLLHPSHANMTSYKCMNLFLFNTESLYY